MADDLNCPYCDKIYQRKGWLPDHIAKKHENAALLSQNMSVMIGHAHDQSNQEAMLNIHNNPLWEGIEDGPVLATTSTPNPTDQSNRVSNIERIEKLTITNNEEATDILIQLENEETETRTNPVDSPSTPRTTIVPLCPNATQFVRQHQASLPLTLTQVLPTLDWTQELNHSLLQDAIQMSPPSSRKTKVVLPLVLENCPSSRQITSTSPVGPNIECEDADDLEI